MKSNFFNDGFDWVEIFVLSNWDMIQLCFVVILILGLLTVYYFIFIFRIINIKKERAKNLIEERVTTIIAERIIIPYINKVDPREITSPVAELKGIINKSKIRRDEFIRVLINFHNLFDGGVSEYIRKIYLDMGLDKYAEKQLFSRNVKKNILALNELEFFKVKSHRIVKRVTFLQRKKKEILRECINFYILNVLNVNLEHFINSIQHPMSQWERLQYYMIITNSNFPYIPNFSTWIHAEEEPSKILLCAELSAHYYQIDASDAIHQLIRTSTLPIKLKLINILGRIYTEDQAEKLKELYTIVKSVEGKSEVLKALGRTGTELDLPFLQEVFYESDNGFIKKSALRSIFAIDVDAFHAIEPKDEIEQIIFNHTKNPLLKY